MAPGGKRRIDRDVFKEVVEANMHKLFASALRLTRSVPDAEDLVQETLVRSLSALPKIDTTRNLHAYMQRVLKNVFINEYRHGKVVRKVSEKAKIGLLDNSLYSSESQSNWSDPHLRFLHSNISTRVEDALNALPEIFRAVLVLADMMDFTYAEIAEKLDIPAGTVMSRLHRARRFMRKVLKESSQQSTVYSLQSIEDVKS